MLLVATENDIPDVREMSMYNHPSNTTLHGKKENMQTTKYARKSFEIEAVQVTLENINKVSEWCGGDIRYRHNDKSPENMYIRVDVPRALNERQRRAYVGDWVLLKDNDTWKVYLDRAFHNSFESVG